MVQLGKILKKLNRRWRNPVCRKDDCGSLFVLTEMSEGIDRDPQAMTV